MKFIYKSFTRLFFIFTLFAHVSNAGAKALPVEVFSRLPTITQVSLSPNGKQIAFFRHIEDKGITAIGVYDIVTEKTQLFLFSSDNKAYKLTKLGWANNKTLLFGIAIPHHRGTWAVIDTVETRLLAIDVNGKGKPRMLVKLKRGSTYSPQFMDNVVDLLPDDPEHILIAVDFDVATEPSVYKLNIYTMKKNRIEKGKRRIRQWWTDQQSALRLGKTKGYEVGDTKIYIRDNAADDWRVLFEYDVLKSPQSVIYPLGFDADPNVLFYLKYHQDKLALFKIDVNAKQEKLVYSHPNYDVDGPLIYSKKTKKVIGIGDHVWDKQRLTLQKQADALLPDTDNTLTSFDADEGVFLIYSESDSTPGKYYLVDLAKKKIEFLFSQYPDIPKGLLPEHQLVSYKARDGVKIEGYLSIPKSGKKPYPTILHPHGGPGARDVSGFDYWTSFMNSRGYAVFRPNFRGSEGYGFAFAEKKMKSWGLAMQDDLTDATKWLIQQGVADPSKVCIVGASYGGYAALMAAVKTPDLYKCAVSFAGLSDLSLFIYDKRYYYEEELIKNQIGDDRTDLKARSPISHVDKVAIPILIAHGENDRVVDVKQSQVMVDALKRQKKQVQYLELEDGDHHLSMQKNRHHFFAELESFLKQNLQ